jgi:hypothetical protein
MSGGVLSFLLGGSAVALICINLASSLWAERNADKSFLKAISKHSAFPRWREFKSASNYLAATAFVAAIVPERSFALFALILAFFFWRSVSTFWVIYKAQERGHSHD